MVAVRNGNRQIGRGDCTVAELFLSRLGFLQIFCPDLEHSFEIGSHGSQLRLQGHDDPTRMRHLSNNILFLPGM